MKRPFNDDVENSNNEGATSLPTRTRLSVCVLFSGGRGGSREKTRSSGAALTFCAPKYGRIQKMQPTMLSTRTSTMLRPEGFNSRRNLLTPKNNDPSPYKGKHQESVGSALRKQIIQLTARRSWVALSATSLLSDVSVTSQSVCTPSSVRSSARSSVGSSDDGTASDVSSTDTPATAAAAATAVVVDCALPLDLAAALTAVSTLLEWKTASPQMRLKKALKHEYAGMPSPVQTTSLQISSRKRNRHSCVATAAGRASGARSNP